MKKGNRVRLSALGRERLCSGRSRTDPNRKGTVTKTPSRKDSWCFVVWDGRTSGEYIANVYLEVIDAA